MNVIKCLYTNNTIQLDVTGRLSDNIPINQGIRQGCSMSPTLFKIHIDDVLKAQKVLIIPGVHINNTTYLNTLLFPADQVVVHDSEYKHQAAVCKLTQIAEGYNLMVST